MKDLDDLPDQAGVADEERDDNEGLTPKEVAEREEDVKIVDA